MKRTLNSQNLKAPIPQMTDSELRNPGENLTEEQEQELAFEELRRIAVTAHYFNKRWNLTN
jgi:hypothetical protein